ncbi:MAG: peptidogalycan biosysnthesis protein [Candidatus Jordarchaeaceae archaeon]
MNKILRLGKLTGLFEDHVLLCYSPMCLRSTVLFANGVNKLSALRLVSSGIDSVCRRERILFSSFLFVPENDKQLTSGLESLGYTKYSYDSTLYLDVVWASFDEYIKSLDYSVRKNVRREIKKFAESGAKIALVNDFGELSSTLTKLRGNLLRKYGVENSPCAAISYKELNTFARDITKMFVIVKNNAVIGFCCCFKYGSTMELSHCGFDYDALEKTDFAYFNVVYYAPIRWAIENGVQRIFAARALPEVKRKRGFRFERVNSFVKCYCRAISSLMAAINKFQAYPE